MLDPDRFAVALAHTVRLFRELPDAKEEQQTALRLLVALCEPGTVKLLADGDRLTVNGVAVTSGVPTVGELAKRIASHRVAAVAIQQGPVPEDVLELLLALAGDPGAGSMPKGGTVGVAFHPARPSAPAPAASPPPAAKPPEAPAEPPAELLIGERPLAEILARVGVETELAHALEELASDPYGKDVLGRASAVAARVQEAFEASRGERGLEALAVLADLEREAPEDPRRHYAIVLGRALTKAVVTHAADAVTDTRHADAARKVLRRAGEAGAAILARRVQTAEGVAERRPYLDALKVIDPKPALLLPMLDHQEWYVVEAAAELLGALAVAEATEGLGRALFHKHPKVREAAAGALARIASGPALELLRQALAADRDEVRQAAARSIGGRASGALAVPLATLVEDKDTSAETMRESFRALVRIGSPLAIKTVLAAAEPGGRMLGRKPVSRRVAAVDALALSDDAAVHRKLAEFAEQDREKAVRDVAARAVSGANAEPVA